MWDSVLSSTVSQHEPPVIPPLALYTLVLCVLLLAAAVVSFGQGSWLGIVWVLLAGLASNMTWYYVKRARAAERDRAALQDGPVTG